MGMGLVLMIMDLEIRAKLIKVLQDELPLPEFEDWLAASSWNMHRDSAQVAQDLVSDIELVLFEHSTENRSHGDLIARLGEIADHINFAARVSEAGFVFVPSPPKAGATLFHVPVQAPILLSA